MSDIDDRLDGWRGRRVVVTGDTGFKGAWLAMLLAELGSEVVGLSLPPEHDDGLYVRCGVGERVEHHDVDIRQTADVTRVMAGARPEVVFHLAAQALVPRSFREPVRTYDVNVVGTASVLAACAEAGPAAVVVITSDKVYENDGSGRPFVESDRLGGGDPYSASKAAAELVVASWRKSFASAGGPRLVTARAGNVIGGGDQADGRLLPDVFRALSAGVPVRLRNPDAVRPWQFVLEPVFGYLRYADRLLDGSEVPSALNFGPDVADAGQVRMVVETILEQWGSGSWTPTDERPGPEAPFLTLDASLARESLGWAPRLDLASALAWTMEWYRHASEGGDCRALTMDQMRRYREMMEP
jgi:CDP-glucose 4,6-dehydratase